MKFAFILLIPFCASGQIFQDGLNIVKDGIATTDLILQANDLVYSTTLVYTKGKTLQIQLERLENLIDNPQINRYLSSTQHLDIITKIQIHSLRVKMYGTALSHMLRGIQRNLEKNAVSMSTQTTLALADAIESKKDNITSKTKAITGGGTDLSGTKRKISMLASDAELRANIIEATNYIEGIMPKVNKINAELDDLNAEVSMLNSLLVSTVGTQFIYMMMLAPKVIATDK